MLVGEGPRNGTRNRRLSRACRAIQPEYWFAVFVVCPAVYVMQQLGAGVREACRVMFFYVRVEGSALGGRQFEYINFRYEYIGFRISEAQLVINTKDKFSI